MSSVSVQTPPEDHNLNSTTGTSSSHLTDGGYDYELLGSTDSRYECPICLLYLRDPVLTTCGHRFCSGCISQWVVKEGGKCPIDGVIISEENIFPDNYTRREIMQCKAKCPFTKDGCGMIMSLSELERHIQSEHVAVSGSPISSKLSNGNPSSSNGVVDCLYKEFGCPGYMPQEQMQQHLETDVHHHLQLLQAAYKRLKILSSRPSVDYTSPPPELFLRQDSRESTRWLLADETMDSDDYQFRRPQFNQFRSSWDSVRFARRNNSRPRYPDRLAESDESISHKSAELRPGTSKGIEEDVDMKQSKLQHSTSMDFKDIYERLVRLEQNDREKQIKIDQLEIRLSSAVNLFSTVTRLMDDLTARYCNGVFVWKIPGFRKLCQEMRKNPNRVINSPGFYTNTFGYKLSVRFNLTTLPSGAAGGVPIDIPLESDDDSHVSLYIHLMQGEFDDTLRWPFCGEIRMSIIHPTVPENSIGESMFSKPDAAAFAKPTLPRSATGFGYSQFCSLRKILSSGFVKDDTLICKVLAKPM